tara:strand:- start:144 stop:1046 length:903 start_codon:yes stop_codon:yes gene_type:complete
MGKIAVITGASGFIGTNLRNSLVSKYDNIILCDHQNYHNDKNIIDPMTLIKDVLPSSSDIEVVFHLGACSDTTCYDVDYMMKENFDYSVALYKICMQKNIRLIYASSAAVYGDGPFKETELCQPKNIYAKSKYLFDEYVKCYRDCWSTQLVGLRYFNVFGPYEHNKGKMASVVYQFFQQIKKDNKIKIFKNSDKYIRDFISVDDVVKVNLHFLENKGLSGIYNCGTSIPRSFADIAQIMKTVYDFRIEEIEMPKQLVSRYQKYTQSDNTKLRQIAHYKEDFLSLEDGVLRYLNYLEKQCV